MSNNNHKKPNDAKPRIDPNSVEPTNTKIQTNSLSSIIIVVISVAISLTAGILSWKCNGRQNIFIRLLLFSVAFLFSEIYLVYYLIYRVVMGNKCSM